MAHFIETRATLVTDAIAGLLAASGGRLARLDGDPGIRVVLRAELDTTFIQDQPTAARLRAEGKNSPDLTHVRIVQAHQTLPLLCQEIYGSPGYYLQVAAANGLDDFRNLRPGQQLVFPPLEK